MDQDTAKLALQIGYYVLLFYIVRRGLDMIERFGARIEAKLDLMIQTQSQQLQETNDTQNLDRAADRNGIPRSVRVPPAGRRP